MTTLLLNPETPTGLAIQQAELMLSQFLPFQESCGASSEEEAAAFVHSGYNAVEDETQKCCAVIDDHNSEPIVLAPGLTLPSGNLLLSLYLDYVTGNPTEEDIRFKNLHESVAKLLNNYNGPGYLFRATMSTPSQRTHPAVQSQHDARPPRWFCQYTVHWGPFR